MCRPRHQVFVSRSPSGLTLFGCKSLDDDQLSLSNSLNSSAIRLVRQTDLIRPQRFSLQTVKPDRLLTRIFHPLLAFPGSQWMEDVVPRTGRGKAREGLFSRLQAHLPLTPLFVNVPGQHSPEVILAPVAQPRCRTGVDKGKRLREGTGFAGYCARRSRQL